MSGELAANAMSPLSLCYEARHIARVMLRMAWCKKPLLQIHCKADEDVLLIDVLPSPPVSDLILMSTLAIALDGEDSFALPTGIALTDFAAQREPSARRLTRTLLGERVWNAATVMAAKGIQRDDVRLSAAERDDRLLVWHQLIGNMCTVPGSFLCR